MLPRRDLRFALVLALLAAAPACLFFDRGEDEPPSNNTTAPMCVAEESDARLCEQGAAECGMIDVVDSCDETRMVDCGGCMDDRFCIQNTCDPGLLESDGEQDSSRFGISMDAREDVLVIGAETFAFDDQSTGAVFVFELDELGSWVLAQTIRPEGLPDGANAVNSRFGYSVSLDDDLIVVGAPALGISSEGGAFVYRRGDDGLFELDAFLETPERGRGRTCGAAVDVDAARERVLVGCPTARFPFSDLVPTVDVYRFAASEGDDEARWQLWSKLTAPEQGRENNSSFGAAAVFDGDHVIVGEPRGDVELSTGGLQADAGRVHVFESAPQGYEPRGIFSAAPPQRNHAFGTSLALAGDALVVGAPSEPGNASPQGSAYVFERDDRAPGTWSQLVSFESDEPQNNDRFGLSIAATAAGDILVGAPNHDGMSEGRATLFRLTDGAGVEKVKSYMPTQREELDNYGGAVALRPPYAFVAAPGWSIEAGIFEPAGTRSFVRILRLPPAPQ